jgi:hypothetical protein
MTVILSYISRLVNEAIDISLYKNFNREVQHRLEDHHPYSKRTVRIFQPYIPYRLQLSIPFWDYNFFSIFCFPFYFPTLDLTDHIFHKYFPLFYILQSFTPRKESDLPMAYLSVPFAIGCHFII